jgi:flagellar protein FlaJ
MKITKIHIVGLIFGLIILVIDLVFFLNDNTNLFLFIIGLAFVAMVLPFMLGVLFESNKNQEISEMFLEFSRNLSESVATGTPVSKSIVNMRSKNYGALTPNIQKLSNQISIGIPLSRALSNFASDLDNPIITRAITLIMEAEKAGGEIDYILESSAKSIDEIETLKKERKAAIYNVVVQGYIIFFIFIGVMLVIEFKILPLTEGLGIFSNGVNLNFNAEQVKTQTNLPINEKEGDVSNSLLFLLLFQGLFAGLVIGKVTEGSIKIGLKHSFILTITAYLISTGTRALFNSS